MSGKPSPHLARAAELAALAGLDGLGLGGCEAEFCARYVAHAASDDLRSRTPAQLAAMIRAHVEVGRVRHPGETQLSITTPTSEADGWSANGSTVILLVTDDRQFLVSTVTMELARRGWTVRALFHPQLHVERKDGVLVCDEGHAVAESWIAVEVFPPLGKAAGTAAPDLEQALRADLADVMAAVNDYTAMKQRVRQVVADLENQPQRMSLQRLRHVVELLQWLVADHFVFLGYREYRFTDGTFVPVPKTGLGILREADGPEFHASPDRDDASLLVITKDSRRSSVQRDAYLDYVSVRSFGPDGRVTGERRFLGLFAASAYTESVTHIPLLKAKAEELLDRSGFAKDSHGAHSLLQAISTFPRDELFFASVETLAPILDQVTALVERRQVRLFVRPGVYGRFLSCVVYLPRDRYTTATRLRIQQILLRDFAGLSLEYQASVTESLLARLFFVVRREDGHPAPTAEEIARVEAEITAATRGWDDVFNEEAHGLASEERGVEFGDAYEASYEPRQAVADLRQLNRLRDGDDLEFALYKPDGDEPVDLRMKVFTQRDLSLTDVLHHLAALGVEVVDERPYEVDLRGRRTLIYDFGLRVPGGAEGAREWTDDVKHRFVEAFRASYERRLDIGRMNSLVLSAGLAWPEIAWLRGISHYLQQAGITFSQPYVSRTVAENPAIARRLVAAFRAKFDPQSTDDLDARKASSERSLDEVSGLLDAVESLDADRILRMFVAVVRAIVRTNAFAGDRPALAFKLLPTELDLLPQPRPAFEIFVYSPRVHGLHLRFGKVARGGLRWSDRKEDFRTEILGLVKAQMVKNTVIVPVGAKGGFVPQRLPDPAVDRAAWLAEGVACYRLFVESLLSVTDNLVEGRIVPPADVVRFDGDDPYLVVAADKGTATFSDIANEISVRRGFWLHDAFASGGSAGYDHKAMGITARGAWESVKRHFKELGLDCQTTDFTCVGIGDMSGDVFGNGMLLSRHLKLVAAFNHLHVFVDPDPDPEVSFAERERLFRLPRSTWADYNGRLLSTGGGIYPRKAKSITLSAQAKAALGLDPEIGRLTPNQVVNAILKAPVDLLWNGGIGTYVKSSRETQAEAGDRANDAVRVDGGQVRARCAGEGGNLGWTQRGRIEYAQRGGRINTDFIDNSAGVDTSDHEVNIKILLSGEMAAGRLTLAERDELLASMTDEVAQLVLAHNIDQNVALSNSMWRAHDLAGAHEDWMRRLESMGLLDRALEAMPSSAEMAERIAAGSGLSRPEEATILAYTKIALKELVLASALPEDPFLADRLISYFPRPLRERYTEAMPRHRLAREIITTVAVNRFVNSQGATAFHRLSEETGAGVTEVIRAQLAARTIFAVGRSETALSRMNDLDAALVTELRMELRRLVERATRWLLLNKRPPIDIVSAIEQYSEGVARVRPHLRELATPLQRSMSERDVAAWTAAGAPDEVAHEFAAANYAWSALAIVGIAQRLEVAPVAAARIYFELGGAVGLDVLTRQVVGLPQQTRWETMARAALRDDVSSVHAELAAAVIREQGLGEGAARAWLAANPQAAERIGTLAQVCDGEPDIARMSVGVRLIRSLLPATGA